ncbi:MAG: hypothetical protein AAB408_01680 [Patescibacteria group bacterium]
MKKIPAEAGIFCIDIFIRSWSNKQNCLDLPRDTMFARDPVSREGENMSKPTLYCFTPADPRWRPLLVGEARGIKAMAMWQKATAVRMWGSEDAREILVDELLDEGSSVVVQLHDGKSLMQFHFGDSFPMATYDPNVESLHPIWWDLAGSFGEHPDAFHEFQIGMCRLIAAVLDARRATPSSSPP